MTTTPQTRLRALARQGGPRFWRGLEELVDNASFRDWLVAEFPTAFGDGRGGGVARRDILKAMGASLVMASLSGCGPEPEAPAVPYVNQPPGYIPGVPRWFATAVPFDGYAQPVLAECHAGRPTRLDGNPQHPMSRGAISAFTQAAVLELYDPDRSPAVTRQGQITTWGVFDAALVEQASRLGASRGKGLRLLTGAESSPTLLRQIDALRRRYPEMRWHGHVPTGGQRATAARSAFGRPLMVWPRLDAARVVVSLEDDILGPGPLQVAAAGAWAVQRRRGEGMPLLFVAESTPSLTGAMAHHRLATASARIPLLAAALAGGQPDLAPAERDWVQAVETARRGYPRQAVVSAGSHQPAETQALCMVLGNRWGEAGRTVSYGDPVVAEAEAGLVDLVADMQAGQVGMLLMLGVNPVYTAPGELDFAAALARVPVTIHAASFYDETAALSHWHLPLAHPLESWSDCRAVDGSVVVQQPLIAPLHQGRTVHQILAGLAGEMGADARTPVRQTWQDMLPDEAWRQALHDGMVAGTAHPPLTVAARPLAAPPAAPPKAGTEVVFRPDPSLWDGRFANSAWLQELPKPLYKVVWDNIVAISPAMGRRLAAETGDRLELDVNGRRLQGPCWVLPGQAADTVTLFLGYGRQRGGRLAESVGYDAYPLVPARPAPSVEGRLSKADGHHRLVSTQLHHAIDGSDLVRVVAPGEGVEDAAETAFGHPNRPSLYPRWPTDRLAWGMVIDNDLCIGCNACVVACQAENNIPTVGKEQVGVGREMHWLRVDRYYEGDGEHPFTHFEPVPCMHCENAPCELGCPVNATVHGPDGINEMIYNRCIGTRTCASYCPYKVRRFNFYFFSRNAPPLQWAQRNPGVTVRARGVMEKCTYCIQRVQQARVNADREQRPIADGAVRTACQNACPTSAIVFGNLADPGSVVAHKRADRRNYGLLDEINTWPRTTYLARIRHRGAKEG
jgi:MoCo/4Fe-4S cofactor protein with predicted Tat translocation signal